jgi:hypothetical protein
MKWCPDCLQYKSIDEFYRRAASPDGHMDICKKCDGERNRRYRAVSKAKSLSPEYAREKMLRIKYGITVTEYDRKYNEQNGCCAICGIHQSEFVKRFSVDHNHETNENRGLLCSNCNRGLGLLGDNIENLKNAVAYYEKWEL